MKKTINPKFKFNSLDYGMHKDRTKENFATVITSGYEGKAYEEIFRKTLGGAPTVDFFGASAIQAGHKSIVQVPVLSAPNADSVFQTFANNCSGYSATNTQTGSYTPVTLVKMGIIDEVCAEAFIQDYFESQMSSGANNDDVPTIWEDALIAVYSESQARGLEKFIWSTLGPIFESGTAGGSHAGMFDTTAVLADAKDSTKVRKVISDILIAYNAANPEIDLQDLVLVLPTAVNTALQLTFVNSAVDNTANARAEFGNIFGVHAILTTYAINQSRIYLLKKDQIVMATDAPNEWTGVQIKNLGDFDAKKLGQIQYSNMFRFGVTLMREDEAGVVKLV